MVSATLMGYWLGGFWRFAILALRLLLILTNTYNDSDRYVPGYTAFRNIDTKSPMDKNPSELIKIL